MYLLTLVILRVQTLSECLTMAKAPGLQRVPELQYAILWRLREYLRAGAAGDPGFLRDSCPELVPEAAFDEETSEHFGLTRKVECWLRACA